MLSWPDCKLSEPPSSWRTYNLRVSPADIFTNETLITKDKRIYVEFEYNDRSYAQSTINSNYKIQNNSISVSLDLFSQTDWKNQSYLNNLSENEKEIISNNGDYNNEIFSNAIDSVSFSENKVLYKQMDTIIQQIQCLNFSRIRN